jgi:hypothetical protein
MKPFFSGATKAVVLACLIAGTASAEASKVEMPKTQNPFIRAVATFYEQGKYEEALSKVEKALEWKSNGTEEVIWLKLMKGVLQAEQGQGTPLESFKEALALDEEAKLPVEGTRRLRKLFEQARSTIGLPTDEELLKAELEQDDGPVEPSGPPPRALGLNLAVRGEVDVLGLGVTKAVTPVVSLGYTKESLEGVGSVLVQPSPGIRAEGRYHPLTLGWVRPYAGLGTTTFFGEKNAQGETTFFGGMSGRAVLGLDVQWNSRMFAFADVTYEHFLMGSERYRSQSVLFSIGVGLFPKTPGQVGAEKNIPR